MTSVRQRSYLPDYLLINPQVPRPISRASAMSQASLPGLAPELKIQIFKSMDSFSSVTVLSSTSRTFRSIWKFNTKSVCDALVQRILDCPGEAKMLLDAQDSSQHTVDAQDFDTNQEEESKPFQEAIEHSQRAFVNARTASFAFKDFDLKASRFSGPGRELSPTERIYFIQAY